MKLNKKVVLGIDTVNVLRTKKTPTRTVDLAREIGTTTNFLEQIIRSLRVAGIVNSVRGPGGGYTINPLTKVTAYDVARAVGNLSEGIDKGDTSPTNKLRVSILDAFLSVTL